MRIMANATVLNRMDQADKVRSVISPDECGRCGRIHYTPWGVSWTCEVCYPPGTRRSSYTIGHSVGYVYRQVRILRRLRGVVVFKAFVYDDGRRTSLDVHGTGHRDRGRVQGRLFRSFREPFGGCPRQIAQKLRRVRGY